MNTYLNCLTQICSPLNFAESDFDFSGVPRRDDMDQIEKIRADRACKMGEHLKNVTIVKHRDYCGLIWNPLEIDIFKNGRPLTFTAHSDTVLIPGSISDKVLQSQSDQKLILKGHGIADNACAMAFGLLLFTKMADNFIINKDSSFNYAELLFTYKEEGAGRLKGVRSRLDSQDSSVFLKNSNKTGFLNSPKLLIALEGTCFAKLSRSAYYIRRYEIKISGNSKRSAFPSVIEAAADFISSVNSYVSFESTPAKAGKKIRPCYRIQSQEPCFIAFTGIKSPFLYNANPDRLLINMEIRGVNEKSVENAEKFIKNILYNKSITSLNPLYWFWRFIKKPFKCKKDYFKDFKKNIRLIDKRSGGELCPGNGAADDLIESLCEMYGYEKIVSSSDANSCIEKKIPALVLFTGNARACHSFDEELEIDINQTKILAQNIINAMKDLKWIINKPLQYM
jgi:hypothetical protein